MFTRYKGLTIPENYSGSRFKAPLVTETKTHKPSGTYGGIKTSISPAFESALKERIEPVFEPSKGESEAFENTGIQDSIDNEQNDIAKVEYENTESEPDNIGNEKASPDKEPASKNNERGNGLLGEFSSLFSQISSKIKSDDLIIIGVILLLLSENSEDNYIILPLLLLLLYA